MEETLNKKPIFVDRSYNPEDLIESLKDGNEASDITNWISSIESVFRCEGIKSKFTAGTTRGRETIDGLLSISFKDAFLKGNGIQDVFSPRNVSLLVEGKHIPCDFERYYKAAFLQALWYLLEMHAIVNCIAIITNYRIDLIYLNEIEDIREKVESIYYGFGQLKEGSPNSSFTASNVYKEAVKVGGNILNAIPYPKHYTFYPKDLNDLRDKLTMDFILK